MDELKAKSSAEAKDLESSFDKWVKFYKENPGSLPKGVQSLPGKVVHMNLSRSAMSPPLSWRSACGWNFYGSNFIFVGPEVTISCQKCKMLCAKSQGG